jgi:hypothetical protein
MIDNFGSAQSNGRTAIDGFEPLNSSGRTLVTSPSAYGPAAPDRSYQLVLADQTVAVLDQKEEQRENLRLGRNQTIVLAQFELAQVQNMLANPIPHRSEH